MGPDDAARGLLVPLGDLSDCRRGENDPDIRGWEVRTLGGRRGRAFSADDAGAERRDDQAGPGLPAARRAARVYAAG